MKIILRGLVIVLALNLLINNLNQEHASAFSYSDQSFDSFENHTNTLYNQNRFESIQAELATNANEVFDTDQYSYSDFYADEVGSYSILEITPTLYSNESSQLSSSLNRLASLYGSLEENNSAYFINNLGHFTVETMSIKQFVSSRDQIENQYDALFFTAGLYNPNNFVICDEQKINEHMEVNEPNGNFWNTFWNSVSKFFTGFNNDDQKPESRSNGNGNHGNINGGNNNENTNIPNDDQCNILSTEFTDLTETKAEKILNEYIMNGQPVFIHEDAFHNDESNFYHYFNDVRNAYNNLHITDYSLSEGNSISYQDVLAYMTVAQYERGKPISSLISKPTYQSDQDLYSIGEPLEYSINLSKQSNVSIYFDFNHDLEFIKEELVFKQDLESGLNEIALKAPDTYSGVYNWKLVVTNEKGTSYYYDRFRLKGQKTEIKVLNVLSDSTHFRNTLYSTDYMTNYFESDEYMINIHTCSINDFKKNSISSDLTELIPELKESTCSYKVIMDEFDVIIMGPDIYSNQKHPNMNVFRKLDDEIENGKPFIFTGQLTNGHHHWSDTFNDKLGFTSVEKTPFELMNDFDRLNVLNKSSYVMYPFNLLNESLSIPENLNYTKNESYVMDVNDPSFVPLLTMYNSNDLYREPSDSYYNSYYTYRDNVVYLNVGSNASETYTATEHKLLVNAITNSYLSKFSKSVKVDVIDNYTLNQQTDYENAIIDQNDQINFNFNIDSLLTGKHYSYKVFVDDEIKQEGTISSNQEKTITLSDLANPTNDVEEKMIRLSVTNEDGRTRKKEFIVFVANLNDYVTITRSIDELTNNQYIELNKQYTIDYSIKFNELDFSNVKHLNKLPQRIHLTNLQFKDEFPEGIDVMTIPNEFNLVGNVETGYNVSSDVLTIPYTLINDTYIPDDSHYKFSIDFMTELAHNYSMNQSTLSFTDITDDLVSKQFIGIDLTALRSITDDAALSDLKQDVFLPFNETYTLTDLYTLNPDIHLKQVQFNLGTILDQDSELSNRFIISNQETLTPYHVGEQEVEIVLTDVFGETLRKSIPITTYEVINSLSTNDLNLLVGEEQSLDLVVTPVISTNSVKVKLEHLDQMGNLSQEPVISFVKEEHTTYSVKGLKPGQTIITFTGYNKDGEFISTTSIVSVKESTIASVSPSEVTLYEDQLFDDFEVTISPYYSDQAIIIHYKSLNPDIATVDELTGRVDAIQSGAATIEITVTTEDGQRETYRSVIYVKNTISDDSGFTSDEFNVNKTESISLHPLVEIIPDMASILDQVTIEFTIVDQDSIATYNSELDQLTVTEAGVVEVIALITQYNEDDEVVKTITRYTNINFITIEDPVELKEEDRH
ncbi:Ig-like domain-containing protein [Haloplasma contractile]|uniref:Ig-like domain protein n=1 Tax=Haloplasma contractile SSD-17B TaxID=1033810 RepID=U2FS85_9MOLU|nr:Ig-like domain-containing protein [Haloplasma contractile]ERJ13809.1 Ig-like domain protein [Haloplasma contractile SSD-17B]